jgi:hypothetical protein
VELRIICETHILKVKRIKNLEVNETQILQEHRRNICKLNYPAKGGGLKARGFHVCYFNIVICGIW